VGKIAKKNSLKLQYHIVKNTLLQTAFAAILLSGLIQNEIIYMMLLFSAFWKFTNLLLS